MLTKRELRVLSALDGQMSVSELAEATGLARSHTSETVAELASKELVRKQRDGKRTVVRAERVEPVEIFRDVVHRHPHVDFSELLHGKALRVLYCLDSPATVAEIAERADEHRNTVHRVVKRLQTRGIVGKNAGTYRLNEEFEKLSAFARALSSHYNAIRTPVTSWTVIWETLDEFLIQTEQDVDDPAFRLTGPRKFADFGVPLVATNRRQYFYSERKETLTPEDVVCHTLLVDDSARYRSYCLLLVLNADVDREALRSRARHYGVASTIDELLEYVDTRGEGDFEKLPAWTDFERTAADYGIEL